MQFIKIKGIYGLEDGMYNTDIIKSLSCDGTSCKGTFLAEKTVYLKKDSFVVPKIWSFEVYKNGNSEMYSNLKSLYDRSSKIDNGKFGDISTVVLASVLGGCVVYAGTVLTSKK